MCLAPRLLVLFLLAAANLPAQTEREPVLYVRAKESGQSSGMSWSTTGLAEYRLCSVWGGPGGGVAAIDLFRQRRSVLALKPGERLQFYRFSESGEGTGKDGGEAYRATTVCLGPGRYLTTFQEPHQTSTRRDPAVDAGTVPQSALVHAELTRTAKGARIVLGGIPGPHVGDAPFAALGLENLVLTDAQRENLYSVELTEADLATWERLTKTLGGTFQAKPEFGGSWTFSATITGTLPILGDVDVEVEGYDRWIPRGDPDDASRPGNTVKVKARVLAAAADGRPTATKAEITFELTDSSEEPGVCLNWPTQAAPDDRDLRLRKSENPDLDVVVEGRKLRTAGCVSETGLTVASFDYAAWGVLTVTAKDQDGKALKVTYHGAESTGIQLPRDEDRNRIADAWQADEGVVGFPADWDEAEVEGQTTKGDGFGLHQEYRGLMVTTVGGRQHRRLVPREKAHFFQDPQGLVEPDQWWKSTGSRAYRVEAGWTQARRVDVHRGFGAGVGKWATRLSKDEAEVHDNASDSDKARARQQWAYTKGDEQAERWTPRLVEYCVVHPGRVRFVMRELKAHMLVSLDEPTTPNEIHTATYLLSLGFTREALVRRIQALGEPDFARRAEQVVQWAALHEALHACGVEGHRNDKGEEAVDCPNRVPDCPMQYPNKIEKLRLLLFGEMGGMGRCCSTAPHLCFEHFSPKG